MSKTKRIIEELNRVRGLEIECPKCGELFSAKAARLFSCRDDLFPKAQKYLNDKNMELTQKLNDIKEQRNELLYRKKEKPGKIKVTTESVNFGNIVEKIIPSFNSFPYNPMDCRALFDPIDYIIFNNLSSKGVVDSIVFSDVKSGNASLKDNQKQIKRLVEKGEVKLTVRNDV